MSHLEHWCKTEDSLLGCIEKNIDKIVFLHKLNTNTKMDIDAWDDLYWKYSILDIPVEGRSVLLRLDLDVPMSDFVPPAIEEHEDEETKLNKSSVSGKQPTGWSNKGGKDTAWSKGTTKTVETGKSKSNKKSEVDFDNSQNGTQTTKKEPDIL